MMKSAVLHRLRRGVWPLLLAAAALCSYAAPAQAASRAGHAPAASATKVKKAPKVKVGSPASRQRAATSSRMGGQLRRRKAETLSQPLRQPAARLMSASRAPLAKVARAARSKLQRTQRARPSTYRVRQRLALKRQDFQCLARNIYHEARGEPRVGKLAVAQITLNRVQAGAWGASVCQVVYAPAQFSWTGQPSKRRAKPQGPDWDESVRVAQAFLAGERVRRLEASTHFHSQSIRPPGWTRQMRLAQQVGQHIFFYDRATDAS